MKQFVVLLLCLVGTAAAQPVKQNVLFRVNKAAADSSHIINYGRDAGLEEGKRGALYVNSVDYPRRKVFFVGWADLMELHEAHAVLNLSLTEGFTWREGTLLLAEFEVPVPNPEYVSIPYKVAANGTRLLNIYNELLIGYSAFEDDGVAYEMRYMQQLLDDMKFVAEQLKKKMEDRSITRGKFAGQSMFQAMENSTVADIQTFMEFMLCYPASYMGKEWRFSEIYATWLINNARVGDSSFVHPKPAASVGFTITDDADVSFPRINSINTAVWGQTGNLLDAGAILLKIGETSLYEKNKAFMDEALSTLPDTGISFTILNKSRVKKIKVRQFNHPAGASMRKFNKTPKNRYARLYPAQREDKYGFIDAEGKQVIPLKFDELKQEDGGIFREGLYAVKQNHAWGFINLLGEMVITPRWHKVDQFREGLCGFELPSDDIFIVKKGYINKKGEEVIPVRYYKPALSKGFSNGRCMIAVDTLYGFINRHGEVVVPLEYEFLRDYSEGLAVAMKAPDGAYGYLNTKGEWAIPPRYDDAFSFHDGRAIVAKAGNYKLIDRTGATVVEFREKPVTGLIYENRPVSNRMLYTKNGKKGIMDEEGLPVTPAMFQDCAFAYSEGVTGVSETCKGDFLSCEGGWYFIDKEGNKVIEGPFEAVKQFQEGVCWVKKDSRWGLIDHAGQWRIQPALKYMPSNFHNGIAQGVRKIKTSSFLQKEEYFYFNKNGSIVWEP